MAAERPASTSETRLFGLPRSFGILLPHFGTHASLDRIVNAATAAERYGFAAVWVRDRLLAAAPHGLLLEAGSTSFMEPLLSLAAVAAATRQIRLGTAVLTCIRHPVKLLQDLGTLHTLAPGRLAIGVGLGFSFDDLAVTGHPMVNRAELLREHMTVIRQGLGGSPVTFQGEHVQVTEARIDPAPPADLPILYGGTSRAAVRRAFTYGQGWIAGRLPIDTFADRMRMVKEREATGGRALEVVTMPITVVDENRNKARSEVAEAVVQLSRSAEGASNWLKPPSGSFSTIEDLSGLLIAGSVEDCAREAAKLHGIGVNHVVFDLRLMFDRISEAIEMLGKGLMHELTH